jgi:hypothetical protein
LYGCSIANQSMGNFIVIVLGMAHYTVIVKLQPIFKPVAVFPDESWLLQIDTIFYIGICISPFHAGFCPLQNLQ